MSSSLLGKSGVAHSTKSALLVSVAALVLLLALGVLACTESTESLVGKWADTQDAWEWEFTAEGKVLANLYVGMEPDYTAENGTITVTSNGVLMNTFQYSIQGETMTLTDPEMGEPLALKRVN